VVSAGFRGAPEFCFELGRILAGSCPTEKSICMSEFAGFGAQGGHAICAELSCGGKSLVAAEGNFPAMSLRES